MNKSDTKGRVKAGSKDSGAITVEDTSDIKDVLTKAMTAANQDGDVALVNPTEAALAQEEAEPELVEPRDLEGSELIDDPVRM